MQLFTKQELVNKPDWTYLPALVVSESIDPFRDGNGRGKSN
jgi:hypothetical protein